MVFITAGMGGGTGTGASHVIARAAKELNILTVGVVTLPFSYEGPSRMRRALQGLEELKKHVDTNIVIPNQNLFRVASEKTTFEESFNLSNRVLQQGVQSVTDLMVRPGLINLDFADVETVMSGMGKAMMGTGEAEGEKRAAEAADTALKNPLIDEYSLKGAKGLLINITGGKDLTLFEVDEAVNKVRAEVDPEAELIIGAITDTEMDGKMRVSIVATALDNQGPQIKPVVSMVHRLYKRNAGHEEISVPGASTTDHQAILNATAGSTALNMMPELEEKKFEEQQNQVKENIFENKSLESANYANVSLESASYLQNTESVKNEDDIPNFEVDSIELATPDLFSNNDEAIISNKEITQETELEIFEKSNSKESGMFENLDSKGNLGDKETEMFENLDSEEDFEIPAFLRRQKN
jgi:cell division protein FtsZ